MVQHLKDEGTRSQVVIAGAISGLLSRFVIAPLDVIKIRLQLQIHSLTDPLSYRGVRGPIYKGIVFTTKEILRREGITVSGLLHTSPLCSAGINRLDQTIVITLKSGTLTSKICRHSGKVIFPLKLSILHMVVSSSGRIAVLTSY